jgi:glycosyltransferase involved in cell wall biosynthesis
MTALPRGPARSPRISVVMPVYNRAGEVAEAIESVLAQEQEDLELIVVDDGSTDGSADVVRGFGDRVRLVETTNGGVGAARNAGIALARGEYLAYCDSDDVQLPFRLAAQAALLDRFPGAAMVCSDFKTWVDGVVTHESHLRRVWLGPTQRGLEAELVDAFREVHRCRTLRLPVPEGYAECRVFVGEVAPMLARLHLAWGCAQMSRLRAVRAVGGHRGSLPAYEDWVLASALAKRHALIFMDLPTCLYRVHAGQLTGRPRLNAECYLRAIELSWVADREFYRAHRPMVDRLRGAALAMLGELEAAQGRWATAERHLLSALRAHPGLRRAYWQLVSTAVRRRIPPSAAPRMGSASGRPAAPTAVVA